MQKIDRRLSRRSVNDDGVKALTLSQLPEALKSHVLLGTGQSGN